jgi:hypothetical protein
VLLQEATSIHGPNVREAEIVFRTCSTQLISSFSSGSLGMKNNLHGQIERQCVLSPQYNLQIRILNLVVPTEVNQRGAVNVEGMQGRVHG